MEYEGYAIQMKNKVTGEESFLYGNSAGVPAVYETEERLYKSALYRNWFAIEKANPGYGFQVRPVKIKVTIETLCVLEGVE